MIDVRLTLRGLLRDWAFTLTAIATLALAIGLNVTVFTVMDTMLFRGHPLSPQADRLVFVDVRNPTNQLGDPIPYSHFDAWRASARAFESLGFIGADAAVAVRDDRGRTIDTRAASVSADVFRVMGVQPALGRSFLPGDDAPGAAPVVVISHSFWVRQLAERADIVGTILHINAMPTTVIGVMPDGFAIVYERALWMPTVRTANLEGGVVGRLRADATVDAARDELDTIERALPRTAPATNGDRVLSLKTYAQAHMSADAPMIYGALWAGGWLVLLIACANLTNLMLVRTIGRGRELATRAALGAGRSRLVRQMLVESFLLAAAGGLLGWGITAWSVRAWAQATASRYLALDYTLNAGTLTYLIGIAVSAALLCSLAPIVRAVQLSTGGALSGGGRGVTQGLHGKRLSMILTAGQMALAMILLSGAGVLVRSLVAVVGAETGVRDPQHVLVGAVILPSDKYPTEAPARRIGYFERLERQLRSLPGIDEVSVASSIPVDSGSLRALEIDGRQQPVPDGERAQFLSIGSNYLRVMGLAAVAGRDLNDRDDLTGPPVALVNQRFAEMYWRGEDPLGQRLRTTDRNVSSEWRIVVGVVPNIMQGDPVRQHFKPLVYIPFRQDPTFTARKSGGTGFRGANLLLRTTMRPEQLARVIRAEVQNADADALLEEFRTLQDSFVFDRDRMDLAHADLGKHAAVAPALAVVAVLLAAIGLFAVIARTVTQRTREIGVRMAIGAKAGDISGMVLRDALWPLALGLSVGVVVSLVVNRLLQSQLVGVSPYDPVTMIGAPCALTGVALLACWAPVRRALQVDPIVALRDI